MACRPRNLKRQGLFSWVRIGWRLFRPLTLTAALVPVLVGTALGAQAQGTIQVVPFLVFLLCALLIQGATNMFNEYYDWRRGLDDAQSVGIAGAIVRDGVPPQVVWWVAWSTVAVAAALGVWLSHWTGSWLLWVGGLCILAGWGYTGGPRPVAYGPLGELVVAVFMGPVIVGVAYYLQAGTWSPEIWLDSVPVGLLVAAILLANNLRDYEQDQARGRKTLAIRLGQPRGQQLLASMLAASGAVTAGLVCFGHLPPGALLALAAAPAGWRSLMAFRRGEGARGMAWTAKTHLQYGLALVGGLFLSGFALGR